VKNKLFMTYVSYTRIILFLLLSIFVIIIMMRRITLCTIEILN
jgi:hypothetical protein